MSTGGEILIALAMAIGLVGVLLPILPGLLVIGAMAVVWAVAEGTAVAWVIASVMIAVLGDRHLPQISGSRTRSSRRRGFPR